MIFASRNRARGGPAGGDQNNTGHAVARPAGGAGALLPRVGSVGVAVTNPPRLPFAVEAGRLLTRVRRV
jgi:hypothetical protein